MEFGHVEVFPALPVFIDLGQQHRTKKAERYARQIAGKLGSVTVVNGVEYDPHPKRIRSSGVAYPKAFWKMIFNNTKGFRRCLYYTNPNNVDYSSDRLKDHVVDCSELQ